VLDRVLDQLARCASRAIPWPRYLWNSTVLGDIPQDFRDLFGAASFGHQLQHFPLSRDKLCGFVVSAGPVLTWASSEGLSIEGVT